MNTNTNTKKSLPVKMPGWILPAAAGRCLIIWLLCFAFIFSCGIQGNERPTNTAVDPGIIALSWKKMAGTRPGKVIFANPPFMVILDLQTGKTRVVPGVTTAGAKGRRDRGKSPRPSWSPDGKRFLYRYNGSIYVCDEQGNKRVIYNKAMNCADETRWSWRQEKGEDWALGPSQDGWAILVKISDPASVKTVYGGGDVALHCEMTGTGKYIVYENNSTIYVAPVGSQSQNDRKKISSKQACRPCAAPDNRVAWLIENHQAYAIYDTFSGQYLKALNAPPDEEIYRLNWSNHPDFAAHMYGSSGNERMHVRQVSTGEAIFIGSGWDPDLWVGSSQ